MSDQDLRSLSLSSLYCKTPLKEYTLYEMIDEIIVIQNLPDKKKIRDRIDRTLRDAIHTGELKAKNGVRYHEFLEYPQFLSLSPKQLSHYIISGDELKMWCVKNHLMVCEVEEIHQSNDEKKVKTETPKKVTRILLSLKKIIEILYEFIAELLSDDDLKNYDPQQKKFILSQYNLIKELSENSLSGISELTLRAIVSSQYWLINDMINSKTANKYNYLMQKNDNTLNVTRLTKALNITSKHRLARDTVKKHISKCLSENGT